MQVVVLVKADARIDLWPNPVSVTQPCVATQTSALMKADAPGVFRPRELNKALL